jgi:6-pyruvoyl-tetrahydropterin synthase
MGMVIDFGTLDVVVKPLIDRMDHRYLISAANVEAGDLYADIALKKGEGFLMSVPQTTAECMGEQIHSWVCDALSCAPRDVIVEVQETPRNVEIFTMED